MITWIKNMLSEGSKESSKRLLATWAGIVLLTYVVCRFTSEKNLEMVIAELCSFICVLLGIAAYEKVKGKTAKDEQAQ